MEKNAMQTTQFLVLAVAVLLGCASDKPDKARGDGGNTPAEVYEAFQVAAVADDWRGILSLVAPDKRERGSSARYSQGH